MRVKELIKILENHKPDAPIFMPVRNGAASLVAVEVAYLDCHQNDFYTATDIDGMEFESDEERREVLDEMTDAVGLVPFQEES